MNIVDKFTNQDDLDELQTKRKKEFEKYIREAESYIEKINKQLLLFNDQISIINASKNIMFAPQIRKLYLFLSDIGNVGDEILPLNFASEESGIIEKSKAKKLKEKSRPDQKVDLNNTFIPTAAMSGIGGATSSVAGLAASRMVPMAAPVAMISMPIMAPVMIGGALFKKFENKKQIEKDEIEFGKLKSEIARDIESKKNYFKQLKEATETAGIFRAMITTINIAISETILPELSGVRALLYAEAINNCIVSNASLTELKPTSITQIENTTYHRHYLFIKNTVHYYQFICELFSCPVFTIFINDVSSKERIRNEFQIILDNIRNQEQSVKECLVFEVE